VARSNISNAIIIDINITRENILKEKMFDSLFSIVLLLNLTGLFSFIAPQFRVNIAAVSLVLLFLNCLYIIVNHKIALRIFHKKLTFYWFIFLIIWPLLTIIYAPEINLRAIGIQVYFFTLLLATIIYITRNGFKSFHRIVAAAIIISVFGLILSMFRNDLFQSVASLSRRQSVYQRRAFGFFMQPNRAARNLVFLFIVWFAGLRKSNVIITSIFLIGFMTSVALTGSRGGVITAAAVVLLICINIKTNKKTNRITISPKWTVILLLVFGGSLGGITLLQNVFSNVLPRHYGKFDITDRLKAISQMKFTAKSSSGESTIANRLETQKQYLNMIRNRLVFGYGFDSGRAFEDAGVLTRSSHNQYLIVAFESGIFRLGLYLFLIILLYIHPKRKQIEGCLHSNSYAQFVVSIILAGMVSNTVLDSRVLYVVLGCFIGLLVYPQKILSNRALGDTNRQTGIA